MRPSREALRLSLDSGSDGVAHVGSAFVRDVRALTRPNKLSAARSFPRDASRSPLLDFRCMHCSKATSGASRRIPSPHTRDDEISSSRGTECLKGG